MKLDPTLQISEQATQIFSNLCERTFPDFRFMETFAWYNGRERGIGIRVNTDPLEPELVVVWANDRQSSGIVVYIWRMQSTVNPPTVRDFSEDAWRNGKSFKEGEISEASDFIADLISQC